MKKISVISVNYNNADGLEITMQSVLGQTCRDFEYIVIDGGSTDTSIEVIRRNGCDCVICEPDHGVYDAMNKGIDMASGEYCIFMNSGDCFYSATVISEVTPFLDGSDFVYGNTHYSDGKVRLSKNEPDYFSYLFKSCYCHQSVFIKTSILKQYHYDATLRIVADWKLYLQTMILGDATFKPIDVNISLYDANGMSSTNKSLYEEERKRVLSELFSERMLNDYQGLVWGRTVEDQLYVEIKHSVLHKIIYSFNVILIRCLTLFSKGSTWAKKYPFRLQ